MKTVFLSVVPINGEKADICIKSSIELPSTIERTWQLRDLL